MRHPLSPTIWHLEVGFAPGALEVLKSVPNDGALYSSPATPQISRVGVFLFVILHFLFINHFQHAIFCKLLNVFTKDFYCKISTAGAKIPKISPPSAGN